MSAINRGGEQQFTPLEVIRETSHGELPWPLVGRENSPRAETVGGFEVQVL
jgi:hypothetical protein